jgi:hypothetical protein
MKCSKYFAPSGTGLSKSESILVPKGASHFKTKNISCDSYVPATNVSLSRLHFFFLRWALTELIKQTRQVVRTFKQSILLACLWPEPTFKRRLHYGDNRSKPGLFKMQKIFILFFKCT